MFLLVLGFFAFLIIAAVVAGMRVSDIFPPRAVGPSPPQIERFDAHPRHICSGDTIRVTWLGDASSGILAAAGFFRQSLDPFPPESYLEFPANASSDFEVELTVMRRGIRDGASDSQQVMIYVHGFPNEIFRLAEQRLTFTGDPRDGWRSSRVFSADPTVVDDWSPRIAVGGLQYGAADGRDIVVSWNGRELATLSPADPIHATPPDVRLVGEWNLFVPARAGEGPLTPGPLISIGLELRCA